MKYLSNNNNNLSNKTLDDILITTEKLFQAGATLYEAGISNTQEYGRVSGLKDIFQKSVLIACAVKNINVDEKSLRSKITSTTQGVAFDGIETGTYKQANYRRNIYSKEFAQAFRTAMDPEVRTRMLEPLRAVIIMPVVPAKLRGEPVILTAA